MADVDVTEQEIQEFLRRAERVHFQSGQFVFEGWKVNTRDLFAPGTDKTAKAREFILTIRDANRNEPGTTP